jgi:hypothetical protein
MLDLDAGRNSKPAITATPHRGHKIAEPFEIGYLDIRVKSSANFDCKFMHA